MNMYAALGLGTVALVAAVALLWSGNTVAAGAAVVVSVAFDLLFVLAVRSARSQRSLK